MLDYVLVALVLPLAGIIATAAVVIFALERFYRIRKLDHEARLRAIEKGYDVPVKRPRPRYPFAWPLVLAAFGLALLLIFAITGGHDDEALGFGLVLFFIGAGLFASRFIGVKRQDDEETARNNALWRSPEPAHAPASGESGESTRSSQL